MISFLNLLSEPAGHERPLSCNALPESYLFCEKLNKAVEIVYVKNNITSHRSIAARADILKNVLREICCAHIYITEAQLSIQLFTEISDEKGNI